MANTVAYTYPVAGATPPTALESKNKNHVIGVITGDNSATTWTFTHNWNISADDLAAGFPLVTFENILAAGQAANPFVTAVNKTANAITVTCTAFTGAAIRMIAERPFSMAK